MAAATTTTTPKKKGAFALSFGGIGGITQAGGVRRESLVPPRPPTEMERLYAKKMSKAMDANPLYAKLREQGAAISAGGYYSVTHAGSSPNDTKTSKHARPSVGAPVPSTATIPPSARTAAEAKAEATVAASATATSSVAVDSAESSDDETSNPVAGALNESLKFVRSGKSGAFAFNSNQPRAARTSRLKRREPPVASQGQSATAVRASPQPADQRPEHAESQQPRKKQKRFAVPQVNASAESTASATRATATSASSVSSASSGTPSRTMPLAADQLKLWSESLPSTLKLVEALTASGALQPKGQNSVINIGNIGCTTTVVSSSASSLSHR